MEHDPAAMAALIALRAISFPRARMCKVDQNARIRVPTPAAVTAFFGAGLIKFANAAARLLWFGPFPQK